MGRVRTLLAAQPEISNGEIFERLKLEFQKDDPTWLRERIAKTRFQLKRPRKKGLG